MIEDTIIANETRLDTIGPIQSDDEADRVGQVLALCPGSDIDTSAPGAAPVPPEFRAEFWEGRANHCRAHGFAEVLRHRGGVANAEASPVQWGAVLALPIDESRAALCIAGVKADDQFYEGQTTVGGETVITDFKAVMVERAKAWAESTGRTLGVFATVEREVKRVELVNEFVAV